MIERFRLDGTVAVVTGAGRGIGRGIALGLAEAGADVVLGARRHHEVESVAAEVEALGRRAVAVKADVRTEDGNELLATTAFGELGRLDAWISNAGGSDERVMRHLADTPRSAWEEQVELNLTAPFLGARTAAGRLGAGGSIVTVSSMAAGKPSVNNGPYAASKAGVNQLTVTLAAELAPRGVRVNAVAPGPVPTEVFMEALRLTPEQLPAIAGNVPLGRLGEPEDIAAAVVYLVSPAASWVTGQVLAVCGGL
ncbi:MAG: SDR family NAD(P)-dependent oxidoreductase [Ilumatobacteraceae bacterium]